MKPTTSWQTCRTLSSATNSSWCLLFYNNPTLRNFAPRIGLAWDPFSETESTAVRAAFWPVRLASVPILFLARTRADVSVCHFDCDWSIAAKRPLFPFGVTGGPFNSTKTEVSLSDFNPKRNYMLVLEFGYRTANHTIDHRDTGICWKPRRAHD